ncbi:MULTISPECIES: DUF1614 domain-containing protein [unclassified Guyparkeria]|uniref:DUF1614 domain-containing protein n=1 Tax=unclassified Guyparkeria TaxID=2626246 RepID=UPI00073369F5|nr:MULTISPECIES: DUF1614 domain-containing protein [unclassified Guyparkeria]KTG17251.1 hypothetical protein AUR63_08785 [Guyparkeria sp. XI15]OAE87228.1 hypothetical protein AWR35_08800 [Guyparkeria sp. WRN-7]
MPNPAFLIAALGLIVLFTLIQLGALQLAFGKLGLDPQAGVTLLFVSLMGSLVNVPLFRMSAEEPDEPLPDPIRRILRHAQQPFEGVTTVAVNLGGCLLPLTFSAYLVMHAGAGLGDYLLAVAFVSSIAYLASRPVPGLGIGMPVLVAPLAAAAAGLLLDPEHSPALAYVGGTVGVLIGADILRLKDVRKLGSPVASIGGAGTFDGIFITGILAVLLA